MAGVVVFLVCSGLSNIALLLGAELNTELDHARAISGGLPEDVEPFAVPRDTGGWMPRGPRRSRRWSVFEATPRRRSVGDP